MGGRIGVISKVGEGSTFWFTVDLAKQNQAYQEPPEIPAELARSPILLLHESQTCLNLIQAKLMDHGLVVSGARNCESALELAGKAATDGFPIGVVILDDATMNKDPVVALEPEPEALPRDKPRSDPLALIAANENH